MTSGWARPRAMRTLWWLSVVATALNGFVVGYGAVWFQLFGNRPSREDYWVGAGGYLAAAGVLLIGLLAAPSLGVRPRWIATVGAVAVVLAVSGLRSISAGLELPPDVLPISGPLDGVGGVILLPWCWVLVVLPARLAWRRRRESSV